MSLNRHQERALAVALRLLEERLAEIDSLMERGEEGVLYRRPVARLSTEQRARMEQLMAELRATIGSLAATFRLPRDEQDPVRRIAGLLSVTWEQLGEIDSRRLGAYGSVDPGLGETLDPAMQHLAQLVLELREVASGPAHRLRPERR